MSQNTCVDFKLGYVDAKSDAIAVCVKTYPSGSSIENRTNRPMHEMQNRMKIAFCVKPSLFPFCLRIKVAPREIFGWGSLSWPSAGTQLLLRGASVATKSSLQAVLYTRASDQKSPTLLYIKTFSFLRTPLSL